MSTPRPLTMLLLLSTMLLSMAACGRSEESPVATPPDGAAAPPISATLKPYSIMVFGLTAPEPVEFEGHYVYVVAGKEIREDISGKGNRSKAFGADELKSCQVRKTSDHGWINLTIRQGAEELFASGKVTTDKPIIYPADLDMKYERVLETFPNLKQAKPMLRGWATGYALHLHHAGERTLPPPAALEPADTVVRLIHMDAGATHTTMIRINYTADGTQILHKSFNAYSVFHDKPPAESDLESSEPRTLTADQWARLSDRITQSGFWDIPAGEERVALDASTALLEIATAQA